MSSSNIRNGEVEIYEFSRGFSEVFENGKWISGGFGNAIDRSNYDSEIPAAIQKFINNNQNVFGIPTGFAPATNEVALIARVIDNSYCVLAVANYQGKDNRGRDGVVGYRYFWLDKSSEINRRLSSMDGIGTLLNWLLKEKLVFDMNPESFTGEKLNCNEYYLSSHNINSGYHQDYPIYPSILTLADLNRDDPLQLHLEAAEEAEKLGLFLAWAWNVSKLYFPEMYVAIWCQDEAARQTIERELTKKDINKVHHLPIPVEREIIKRTDREHLTGDEKSIEIKLDEFVKANSAYKEENRSEKARAILGILSNDEYLDWSKFFSEENQHIKYINKNGYLEKESVRYYAIQPLLLPEKIIEWLNWLQEPKNEENIEISFEIQRFLFNQCNEQQRKLILQRIYDGISILLDELVNSDINNYQICRWLLVNRRSNIWAEQINQYVTYFLIFLERKFVNANITQEFGGEITQKIFSRLSDIFVQYQQPPSENNIRDNFTWWKVPINNPGLSNLANLLREKVKAELKPIKYLLNQYNKQLLNVNFLSAICYQYSEGSIPSNVYSKLNRISKRRIQAILRIKKIQERGHSLRRWRNGLIISILILGIPIILVQLGSELSTYLFQDWPGSSDLYLEESIAKCRNIETYTDQSSDANHQQLQRCKIELSKLHDNEIEKINKLQKEETPEPEKDNLRKSQTYLYIKDKFPLKASVSNSPLDLNKLRQESDKNVLSILGYLKQSLDREEKTYSQIFKDLGNCLKKDKIQDFRTCIQKP